MRKQFLSGIMIIAMVGLMLTGCAQKQPLPDFAAQDLNPLLASGNYTQKAENFQVVLDSSASMADHFKGYDKLGLGKEIIRRFDATVPNLKLMGGQRSFGPDGTKLHFGQANYTSGDLVAPLKQIKLPGGVSPMAEAILAAGDNFSTAKDDLALIIVSDGLENVDSAVAAIQVLKEQYRDRLCIYTILVGDAPEGKNLMDKVADAGGCGIAANGDNLFNAGPMAGFVQTVFFTGKAAATPAPKRMMDPDRDKDGLVDRLDTCPDSPMGATVDKQGCWILADVLFDIDKSYIRGSEYPKVEDVLRVMKQNPGLKLKVIGHTDSQASSDYNQKLSQRRADTVKKYFVDMGIDADRLSASWEGLTNPRASNKSAAGRQQNRRVELRPDRR